MAISNLDINQLSRDERLDLIEELWESLPSTQNELALTDAQRQS